MNDRIDEFFEREREAVPLLAPPAGRFEELQTVARRRRNRNTTVVSAAAVVVLAVVGTGAVLGAQNLGHSNNLATVTTPTVNSSISGHSATPSAGAGNAAVPTGFRVSSVSFIGNHGWALGSYSCGATQCAAVLRTDDYTMPDGSTTLPTLTWRTIFRPSADETSRLGLTSSTASIRLGNQNDGWIVSAGKVLATRDGGSSWSPVTGLASHFVTALEASSTKAFAVTADGNALWISKDVSGSWQPKDKLDLPAGPATAVPLDTIQLELSNVVVTRTLGATTTARFSQILAGSWSTVELPCTRTSVAPLFSVIDKIRAQVVCGDGKTAEVTLPGGSSGGTGALPAGLLANAGVVAGSISTNTQGSVAAYTGAGLVARFIGDDAWHVVQSGSFGYVGLSSPTRGVALASDPTSQIWLSSDGGRHWVAQSFG